MAALIVFSIGLRNIVKIQILEVRDTEIQTGVEIGTVETYTLIHLDLFLPTLS